MPAIILSSPARHGKSNRDREGNLLHGHITMLILSRRMGESIIIADNVTVTVLSVKGKQVRIGIEAPDEVAVHREEIYDRIKQEKAGDPDTKE